MSEPWRGDRAEIDAMDGMTHAALVRLIARAKAEGGRETLEQNARLLKVADGVATSMGWTVEQTIQFYNEECAEEDMVQGPPYDELFADVQAHSVILADVSETYEARIAELEAENTRLRARLRHEEARRELTRLIIEARPTSRPDQWRYRRRSSGADVTATVSIEDGLVVVVGITVRGYSPPRGGQSAP